MLELSPRRTANPQAQVARGGQQSRLLLALILLLAALAAVLIKDRQFWFGADSTIVDADESQPAAASQTAVKPAAQPMPASKAHAAKKQNAAANISNEPTAVETPAVVTTRTVLPPLDVEVVAGDRHNTIHPGSNATKLEVTKSVPAVKQPGVKQPATNAAEQERIAATTIPAYPPLAQHMNVQGAVVLQALIGADGIIQNLRVMSGPAILSSAAQAAVRGWHFKPITQNGQAVESKATITVNFSIKVSDSSTNATVAESRPDELLVLTR